MRTAVILGAGFSQAAGFPRTRDLFESTDLPRAQSPAASENYLKVRQAYGGWKAEHPDSHAEHWLAHLYELRENPLQEIAHGTTWDQAVRYALAQLVHLPPGRNAHYYYGICNSDCHPVHGRFWKRIRDEYHARSIVTVNYDILVEQALHSEPSRHRTAPACYYGGFQHVQVVRKLTNVVKQKAELVQLGNEIALYKLHGSLNWAWERHSPTLKIHQDVRAVFRHDNEIGPPAIVPPIPEKQMPMEFAQVWTEARKSLNECDTWIVCGYSLPEYDIALREFFGEILRLRKGTTILLLDPYSHALCGRWTSLAPAVTRVKPLPGIPEALDAEW